MGERGDRQGIGKAASELEDPARKGVASGIAFVSRYLQGGEAAAATGGVGAVLKMKVRLRLTRVLAESRTTGGKTAGGAEGLAQGPDQDVA